MAARIQWNRPAFEAIRRSPGVTAELSTHADRVASAAGEGYLSVHGHGRTRNRAAVVTTTGDAMRDNARNNTLLRVLGSGS